MKVSGDKGNYKNFSRNGFRNKKNGNGKYHLVGKTKALNGYVYVYGIKGQDDTYLKTTEAIAEYVGIEYGKKYKKLVEGTESEPAKPKEPKKPKEGEIPPLALKRYEREWDFYIKKLEEYKVIKGKVFVIIIGQCSLSMKNKLESLPEYKQLDEDDDVIGLLKLMKSLTFAKMNVQYEYWTLVSSMKKLFFLQQHRKETLPSYYRRFAAARDVVEEQNGSLFPTKIKEAATSDTEEVVRDKYHACIFLAGVDKARYGKLIDELNNAHLTGQENYPESVEAAMNMLSHRMDGDEKNVIIDFEEEEKLHETSFAQKGQHTGKNVTCFNCGKKGHIAPNCPEKDSDDESQSSAGTSWYSQKSGKSTKTKKGKGLHQFAFQQFVRKKTDDIGWSG